MLMDLVRSRDSASGGGAPPSFDLEAHLRRGESEVFAVVTTLTPALAAQLMERNPDNRKIRQRHVGRLAHAIQTGAYALNGETLIVSRDGWLNDGQHRCQAVVETGTGIPAVIVFGVERETRSTVDTGDKRTMGNVLYMHGLGGANANGVAAVIRFVLQYDSDTILAQNTLFDPTDYIDLAQQCDDELYDCYRTAKRIRTRYKVSPGLVGGAIFVCGRVDKDTTAEFCEQLASGLKMEAGDPAAALARRYSDHTMGRAKLTHLEQAALFIKSFNDVRKGKHVAHVRWTNAEDFPIAE